MIAVIEADTTEVETVAEIETIEAIVASRHPPRPRQHQPLRLLRLLKLPANSVASALTLK